MRSIFLSTLIVIAATAGAAAAQTEREEPATTQRVLYVCDASAETQRAFRIEHGSAVYMTAEEVLASQARNEAWESARCITAEEAQRLANLRMQQAAK